MASMLWWLDTSLHKSCHSMPCPILCFFRHMPLQLSTLDISYFYCMFAIVCVSVTTGGPTTDAQFGECVKAIQVVASQYQQKTKHHCLACLWAGRASCMTWAKREKQTTAKSWCILLWARKASLSCIRFVAYHLGQQKMQMMTWIKQRNIQNLNLHCETWTDWEARLLWFCKEL